MKLAQGLLLAGFVVCALVTIAGQVRFGMIAGQNESGRMGQAENDPRALAWRKRSRIGAVGAVLCLAGAMLLGALSMQ